MPAPLASVSCRTVHARFALPTAMASNCTVAIVPLPSVSADGLFSSNW
jgi:hypothetical protein